MTLVEQQIQFSRDLALLLTFANVSGYGVSMGECWRSEQEAARLDAAGLGIKNSLHRDRLAVDLLLRVQSGDKMIMAGQGVYKKLADYWLSLHEENAWGGDWGDFGHYSSSRGGRK